MARLLALVALAAKVLGQQAYDEPSMSLPSDISPSPSLPAYGDADDLEPCHGGAFHYHGCAEVDVSRFTDPIVFTDGLLIHDQCQTACAGHEYAALFPDSCRCGNDASAVTPLDDSVCDNQCMGDPSLGMCRTKCPSHGPGVSTVYSRNPLPDPVGPVIPDVIPDEPYPTPLDPPVHEPPKNHEPMPSDFVPEPSDPGDPQPDTTQPPEDPPSMSHQPSPSSGFDDPPTRNSTDVPPPRPSNSDGDPPSPSVVPQSSSESGRVLGLATLQGLVLVAVMVA